MQSSFRLAVVVLLGVLLSCNIKEKARKAEARVQEMAKGAGTVASVGCSHTGGHFGHFECSAMFDDGTVMTFLCDGIYPEQCTVKTGRIDVRIQRREPNPEDL